MSVVDRNCTFLISTEKSTSVQQEDVCKDLENTDVNIKIRGLKNAIVAAIAGESMPRVLMTVIRYCITCDDHQLKKLLMLYWEIVPKYSADNKLMPEMILVCNALRNDLTSPNEYIRGCMLRFLCKLKEPELLEPLVPSIKQCLEHRHSYVRRNAALSVLSIHRLFGDQLMPDAAEIMEKFINQETDMASRRNAFLMLFNEADHIAIDFLSDHMDDIKKFGDGFALLVLELTRKTCRKDPAQKSRFVRCLFQLLRSESPAVSYEAAWTLVSLSSAPTAVRAAAQTYTSLLNSSADNNVKLIVLDRLAELKKHHTKVVQEVLLDILRALSSPHIDICKKTLALAIDMVSPKNIEEVMMVLKREVVRAQESDMEHRHEYKKLLISAIHKCAIRYAEVADSVVLILLDFVAGSSGYDVMVCVKSIVEQYPSFRPVVIRKVIDNLDEISTVEALCEAMWLLGEYADTVCPNSHESMLLDAYDAIQGLLGEAPFAKASNDANKKQETEATTTVITKNVVLADGTYATVTKTETTGGPVEADAIPHIRKFVSENETHLISILANALTKITLRVKGKEVNRVTLSTALAITGLARVVEIDGKGRVSANADTLQKLSQCLRVLLDPAVRQVLGPIFLQSCHDAYSKLVLQEKNSKAKSAEEESKRRVSQADDLIQFRQLRAQAVQGGIEVDLMDADDISRAIGSDSSSQDSSRLKRVHQLTGFSDPVYAEATLTVHDYDIILDLLVINRTPNTLTNVTVELATMGDLKIVERPQTFTIGPLDERKMKANIKVSSTETGHIFGTVVFDNASNAQKTYVTLNDIQLDIMDYIRPAVCKPHEFSDMWAEFEWENKVAVNTNMTDMKEFLNHIATNTNMTCLTPIEDSCSNLAGCNFLAANLYSRSVFGEDALVNVSVERKDDEEGKLSGYIRIRSKTQGIAISLGDRFTTVQRKH